MSVRRKRTRDEIEKDGISTSFYQRQKLSDSGYCNMRIKMRSLMKRTGTMGMIIYAHPSGTYEAIACDPIEGILKKYEHVLRPLCNEMGMQSKRYLDDKLSQLVECQRDEERYEEKDEDQVEAPDSKEAQKSVKKLRKLKKMKKGVGSASED